MNSAQYGSNVAAYPIRLIVNIYDIDNYTSPEDNNSMIANGYDNKTILLENVSSGNDFPYVIVIKTVDLYGNVIELDNAYINIFYNNQIIIWFRVVDLKFYSDDSNGEKYQLNIQGDGSVTAINGLWLHLIN